MLILTRRPGECVYIGDDITITALGAKGNQMRLGFDAPKSIKILRDDLVLNGSQEVDDSKLNLQYLLAHLDNLELQKEELQLKIDSVRSNILAIHKDTGAVTLEASGFKSTMVCLPLSMTCLKEEYGIKEIDIPKECYFISETIKCDMEKLKKYLIEEKKIEIEARWSIRINKVAMKQEGGGN